MRDSWPQLGIWQDTGEHQEWPLDPGPLHHAGCQPMATLQGLPMVAHSPQHGFHVSTCSLTGMLTAHSAVGNMHTVRLLTCTLTAHNTADNMYTAHSPARMPAASSTTSKTHTARLLTRTPTAGSPTWSETTQNSYRAPVSCQRVLRGLGSCVQVACYVQVSCCDALPCCCLFMFQPTSAQLRDPLLMGFHGAPMGCSTDGPPEPIMGRASQARPGQLCHVAARNKFNWLQGLHQQGTFQGHGECCALTLATAHMLWVRHLASPRSP